MEGGAKAKGNRCVTRMGVDSFVVINILCFYTFTIYCYCLIGRCGIFDTPGKKKEIVTLRMGFGRGGGKVLCFFPKKKSSGVLEFINWL